MSSEPKVVINEEEENNTEHNHHDNRVYDHSHLASQRHDSLDMESRDLPSSSHASKGPSMSVIIQLAFQSMGIVYGDLGTSPLYVYSSIFADGVKANDDILGVFSLIFYTITLVTLVKYVFIVLRATDNGDGGTFALYSLICRYAKVGILPNQQIEDAEVSNYKLESPKDSSMKRASWLKSILENSYTVKILLLLVTMLGTSMVIGDGILTPCISVLSAMGGIKVAAPSITNNMIVELSICVLIFLFMVQRFGTDKVGYSFAPIMCLWFTMIGGIGLYNLFKYDPTVVKAINPKYIVEYFIRNKKDAWISLGGVVMCITGAEALFADVGHFTVRSIQISTCCVVYPALIFAYSGQSSYLRKHNDAAPDAFYKSVPHAIYWPQFVVAVMAAIIASQSLISGTFSIIQQSLSLGCFPRVKIVHTSIKYPGQVYIPEINFLLMISCIAVTAVFKTTIEIGNAYGIAVVMVMTITSTFMVLVMIMIWKTNILLVICYVLIVSSYELALLSSVLYKFKEGGYLPLAFAAVLMSVMYIWNDVFRRKYSYELDHKISPEKLKEVACGRNLVRIPGLALFYSELVQGIPPIFKHYVENVPALHSVVVFVTIKFLPISKVPIEERFLFRQIEEHQEKVNLNMFRCVARYGYADARNDPFEDLLVKRLKKFLEDKYLVTHGDKESLMQEAIEKAAGDGIVHLIGESEVIASKGSGIMKRILIDYAYDFVKRNLRQGNKVFDIPHKRLVKVGMIYQL